MSTSDGIDSRCSTGEDGAVPTYGYVTFACLIVLPMALRADWPLVVNLVGLVGGTAGVVHVHLRTVYYPVRTTAMIDERDYTLLLLGVGAFLAADYANYRVTAYFVVAGFLVSYWNGKVSTRESADEATSPETTHLQTSDTQGDRSEPL